MSRRFWLVASLFYIGALLTNLAFFLGDECGFSFIPSAELLFVGMILILLLFEWWAYRRYGDNMTRRKGIGLLVAHMVLFEMTSAVDCSATTTFLYLLIPFIAYLFVNKWVAVGLVTLYSIWFVTYFQLFRVDSFAEFLFRSVIFGLTMVFSLAMASIVKEVLVGRSRERRLHGELLDAHHQLEAYVDQMKELGAAEERNRLARDIHDSIGHYLAAVTVQLEKALAFHLDDPVKSEKAIRDAQQAARDALRDVRRSVSALRQSAEFFSLTRALEELVRHTSNGGLTMGLQVEGDEIGYSKSTLMALYRVAQEGLTNVQKHAGAAKAQITLHMNDEKAALTVEDDGTGFELIEPGSASPGHQGLSGMRERLELVGGQLTFESNLQTGTKLIAVVPKQPRTLPEKIA